MNFLLAVLVVIGFAATIAYLDLPGHAQTVRRRSTETLQVLRDESRDDREKEKELQAQAGHLFGLLGILVGGSILALGVPLLLVWGLGQAGIGSFDGTLSVLERIDFLAGVTVLGLVGYLLIRRFSAS